MAPELLLTVGGIVTVFAEMILDLLMYCLYVLPHEGARKEGCVANLACMILDLVMHCLGVPLQAAPLVGLIGTEVTF